MTKAFNLSSPRRPLPLPLGWAIWQSINPEKTVIVQRSAMMPHRSKLREMVEPPLNLVPDGFIAPVLDWNGDWIDWKAVK